MDKLSTISSWASILGLIVSIVGLVVTFMTLQRVKKWDAMRNFAATVPVVMEDLRKHNAAVATALGNFPDSRDNIIPALSSVKAALVSLSGVELSTDDTSLVKVALESIEKAKIATEKEPFYDAWKAIGEVESRLPYIQLERTTRA